MASKFQSRLVGTIILVAIGVIVLPDVLDGKKLHYKEEFASIPIKPELDSNVEVFEVLDPVEDQIALPDSPVEQVVESGVADNSDTQTASASNNKEADEVAVVVKQVPEKNEYQDSAWIIQLMALKNADNAKNVVTDLQKRGYQAHTKQEKTFTRVIIGPDVSKSKLERQIKELEKITGSKGQLLKFKPLNP
ncbi:SPOR domain-containing protein [Vibrio sp. 10N.261.46.E12]|uniref:SPOR domain-containing protein n=1 Tax=unclassified Vibrio TaxID=2614977 RepID=UPI000975DCB0|nr:MULTISPECIES: SPOR domain-containing protein [unclassified Vibrio]OMO36327.1 cell division protein DedD [Vibrio sp. 10N.261.45.E1]PMJ23316.1 cell division protein DedD [Vibrio sp. 10N.286.45.B6]PML95148.1 cell division protein DedD [Vibrio sp. 10N.261.49.E11]PMM67108.1 cell division protein DedD [Vibrio sp. 10N.261.46.F12]PMM79940.1 cell division protein DedD [Vibrio sp. 10N.261.46.E8]